jgi:membrane-bound lytic murein transglycosylase B
MRSLALLLLALVWAMPLPASGADVDAGLAAEDVETLVETPMTFERWLGQFLAEARERGFSDDLLARTLGGIRPLPQVVQSDRRQPEMILTFEQYFDRRVTPEVVRQGQELLRGHAPLLARVREAYGVHPAVIVAVWGMESQFGRSAGHIPVFPALATLAWEPRRATFFRAQLYDALAIVARGDIDESRMTGSWAGAMGQPQFMPSSYLAYAVDFDGDGRRDIWTSHADTFASIANYLARHGWRGDETWGHEVRVPPAAAGRLPAGPEPTAPGCRAMRSIRGPMRLDDWQRLGVRRADGGDLPTVDRQAGLVEVDRRRFLVHRNYMALLRYNCAHHYALTVALLADRLGHAITPRPEP